eukprot:TRINITY_DN60969_c0_g1_i1.p1 TRINITY_DN60969_c0_g1~~TRINITY_DN60969_c0_g1_i1.p1  ORF type:complete len:401 (-),score=68.74 TRINITY_DN60969_c0_g1_i1:237-1310(-)
MHGVALTTAAGLLGRTAATRAAAFCSIEEDQSITNGGTGIDACAAGGIDRRPEDSSKRAPPRQNHSNYNGSGAGRGGGARYSGRSPGHVHDGRGGGYVRGDVYDRRRDGYYGQGGYGRSGRSGRWRDGRDEKYGGGAGAATHERGVVEEEEEEETLLMKIGVFFAQLLSGVALVVISHLFRHVYFDGNEDAMRAVLGIILLGVSSWAFVMLTFEAKRREKDRAREPLERYQGVFKRFSKRNGWGLISVPGGRDVRIHRHVRDSIGLQIGEVINFALRIDPDFPGCYQADDIHRVDVPDTDSSSDSSSVENAEAAEATRSDRRLTRQHDSAPRAEFAAEGKPNLPSKDEILSVVSLST